MVLLSVVIPAFGVASYLRECLDSVLAQADSAAPDEIEIVAVDDASPDDSGAILAEYAQRDRRVRTVTFATNQGLSAARNAGLRHASGAYVWFVDGDDWLTPGAVGEVVRRLREDTPDVLVVGYARVYSGGRTVPERLVGPVRAHAGAPLPAVFTLAERPDLLYGLHIACNKVVRRQFLLDLGVSFAPGWYEDVSFSHPVLLAAARIAVLDQVCYGYRQRAEGAITRTRTRRHFEVFDQWHRVFAFLDAHPGYDQLRPLIFQRMIWHYLGVLNHPDRVDRRWRRGFFQHIVRDYRRYRPAGGYPRPGGVANLSFAFVAAGAYVPFELSREVYRSRHRLTRTAAQVTGRTGRAPASVPRQVTRDTADS
jgi:CDP-glycerol glycerophosphotransferase